MASTFMGSQKQGLHLLHDSKPQIVFSCDSNGNFQTHQLHYDVTYMHCNMTCHVYWKGVKACPESQKLFMYTSLSLSVEPPLLCLAVACCAFRLWQLRMRSSYHASRSGTSPPDFRGFTGGAEVVRAGLLELGLVENLVQLGDLGCGELVRAHFGIHAALCF